MKYRLLALVACASIVALPAHAIDRTTPINITNSVTATTGSFSAALGAVAGTTNYICGFVITSGGSSAASVVTATGTGTISGALNFSYVFPSSGQGDSWGCFSSVHCGCGARYSYITVKVVFLRVERVRAPLLVCGATTCEEATSHRSVGCLMSLCASTTS